MEPAELCDRLAAAQHGVLSRRQALDAGLTERAIDGRLSSGRWQVVHAGVYVPTAVPASWHQRVMAAILRGGASALASHRCATALWQLDGLKERPVEISLKAGRRIRGAIVHRRRASDDPSVVVFDGIPATDVERTLLDLAAVITPRRLALALEDALRRGSTTLESMRELVHGQKGRAGLRTLRQLLDARDDRDSLVESRLESALLRLLTAHALPLPVPQHRVMDGAGFVARLDFAYPQYRLGVETDGYRWHGGLERRTRDLRRENRLKLLGWTVLRFSWDDVHNRPETVASQIGAALAHASTNLSR